MMKALYILVMFNFVNFSCDAQQSSMSMGVYGGYPMGFNKEASRFIQDEMQLGNSSSFAYGFIAKNISGAQKFDEKNYSYLGTKIEILFNDFRFHNDSLYLKYTFLSGMTSLGYRFSHLDKFIIDVNIDFGVTFNTESFYSDKSIESIYQSYLSNDQNYYVKSSKLYFNIGPSIAVNYMITKRLGICAQYKYLLLPTRKVGYIKDISLFKNYSNLVLGLDLVFHEKNK